ncbi:2514_t:CDS:2 [Entrophospora sp. SA101]|nr:6908_t:CDS:2 [Entrophospora sp. SA101]CAJ0830132.1 2514_t:CDS:2 [Entrophospora sp. SA101]
MENPKKRSIGTSEKTIKKLSIINYDKIVTNKPINVDKNITTSNKKLQQSQEVSMKGKEPEKIEEEKSEKNNLPTDFFDDPTMNNNNNNNSIGSSNSLKGSISTTQEKSSNQVDEQEWVKFQKLISKETQLSDQIANADDEELQKDRDEMQEREQEGFIKRLERLKEFANNVRKSREKIEIKFTNLSKASF